MDPRAPAEAGSRKTRTSRRRERFLDRSAPRREVLVPRAGPSGLDPQRVRATFVMFSTTSPATLVNSSFAAGSASFATPLNLMVAW